MSAWPSRWLHLGAEEMAKWAESTCTSVVRAWIWVLGTGVKARQCEHPRSPAMGTWDRDRAWKLMAGSSRAEGDVWHSGLSSDLCVHTTHACPYSHTQTYLHVRTHTHQHVVWIVISMNYNSKAYHLSNSCWSRWVCDLCLLPCHHNFHREVLLGYAVCKSVFITDRY